jgi:hypothetical protein
MTHENAPEATVSGAEARAADEKPAKTLVDTLFDIGLTWAERGVGQGRRALETSARTLEKVAQSLHDLQLKLRKDTTAAS